MTNTPSIPDDVLTALARIGSSLDERRILSPTRITFPRVTSLLSTMREGQTRADRLLAFASHLAPMLARHDLVLHGDVVAPDGCGGSVGAYWIDVAPVTRESGPKDALATRLLTPADGLSILDLRALAEGKIMYLPDGVAVVLSDGLEHVLPYGASYKDEDAGAIFEVEPC